ncbi:hypothetical protein DFJ73DRAFT_288975 [Zopfochytrium polystomum]|nr:hypothetical protein DFJ73DRAFT_288975 [Zopfochytrium polystomum]
MACLPIISFILAFLQFPLPFPSHRSVFFFLFFFFVFFFGLDLLLQTASQQHAWRCLVSFIVCSCHITMLTPFAFPSLPFLFFFVSKLPCRLDDA